VRPCRRFLITFAIGRCDMQHATQTRTPSRQHFDTGTMGIFAFSSSSVPLITIHTIARGHSGDAVQCQAEVKWGKRSFYIL
jgi:hypothetical protein